MRQGFKKFLETGDDVLVMLDCDGTYHPEEITKMVESIPEGGIAIGDRLRGDLKPDAMTSTNWIGNQLLTWLAVALHGKAMRNFRKGSTNIPVNKRGFWNFHLSSLFEAR